MPKFERLDWRKVRAARAEYSARVYALSGEAIDRSRARAIPTVAAVQRAVDTWTTDHYTKGKGPGGRWRSRATGRFVTLQQVEKATKAHGKRVLVNTLQVVYGMSKGQAKAIASDKAAQARLWSRERQKFYPKGG